MSCARDNLYNDTPTWQQCGKCASRPLTTYTDTRRMCIRYTHTLGSNKFDFRCYPTTDKHNNFTIVLLCVPHNIEKLPIVFFSILQPADSNVLLSNTRHKHLRQAAHGSIEI